MIHGSGSQKPTDDADDLLIVNISKYIEHETCDMAYINMGLEGRHSIKNEILWPTEQLSPFHDVSMYWDHSETTWHQGFTHSQGANVITNMKC